MVGAAVACATGVAQDGLGWWTTTPLGGLCGRHGRDEFVWRGVCSTGSEWVSEVSGYTEQITLILVLPFACSVSDSMVLVHAVC